MTYAEACQYAAEVRERRSDCNNCAVCQHKEIEAQVKRITAYWPPVLSLKERMEKNGYIRKQHTPEEMQSTENFLQMIGRHKTLPKPVITNITYTMTQEERKQLEEYVKMNSCPF